MTTLVIVEAPGKLKKIRDILGAEYRVEASGGHVRDLPANDMGVDLTTFRPLYEKTTRGKDVLAKLRAAVDRSDRVLLATDADREGEAIAWHLADALKLKQAQRITYQAIAEQPIRTALKQPRPIDMQLVHAQEARRVLDRLVGYTVSPLLSEQAGQPLSAGRVQSPALRLIVERERAIRVFKHTQHYGAVLHFAGGWTAAWNTRPHLADGTEHFIDAEFAQKVAAVRCARVSGFEDGQSKAAPPAPFITSTLQQAAEIALKLKPKAAMDVAQQLYEQGAITYHRTDAPNLSTDGYEQLVQFAADAGIPLAQQQRTWKAKDGAQEAHEAIRPAHFQDREAGETTDQKALYRLIWTRAVASQMPEAMFAVRTATLDALEPVEGRNVSFIARGQTLVKQGWKAVYDDLQDSDTTDLDETGTSTNPVPLLALGENVSAERGERVSKITKAPARFKQSTLVKELERLGIGRPATYAAILENIISRGYLAIDGKGFLSPLPTAEAVVDALVGHCQFIELDYTRELEDQLDAIADGKSTYLPVVGSAYRRLIEETSGLQCSAMHAAVHTCPECAKPLRRRSGKNGYFWGCSGYPECAVTMPDDGGKPGERPPPATISKEHRCPQCTKPLAHRTGTGAKGKYDFWGCTGYPKCKASYRSDAQGNPIFPQL